MGVNPWQKQIEIIESIRDTSNTCVASAHGVGKTFTASCASLWFLFCFPRSRVITTAPTARQVESILWEEIRAQYNNSRVPLGGRLLKTSLSIDDKWFALGLSTDDPTRFQGQHAEHLLLVVDEAPGVEDVIYEAAQGILTSRYAKCLLIGNPTSASGYFYDCFHNPLWSKFFISAYDSPGVTDPDRYPTLTTMKWINERKAEWGESSPMFQARVLGQFPEEGEDVLIPLSWCERAARRGMKEKDKKEYQITDRAFLGLDVARFGSNRTVLTTFVPNKVQRIKSVQTRDTMEAVRMVVAEATELGTKLIGVAVDDTGLGGGVTDRLRELGYPVTAVNFSNKSSRPNQFKGIRDEMYWDLRELFRADEIVIPDNERLIAQLSSIKYIPDKRTGIIRIETKDEMRKRGLKSPDEADSLALAVWRARSLNASSTKRKTIRVSRARSRRDVAYY